MKLIKKSDHIKTVAERYKKTYYINDKWTIYYFDVKDHKKNYELLKKATTEKEIEDIIGNSFWTENKCSECGKDCNVLVEIGEEPDYETATAWLCPVCIKRAFEFISSEN